LKLEQLSSYQGINLYIKNLEDEIDQDLLMKEFSAFGNIRSVKIMPDDKGDSKGFGFICFTTAEEAQHAINDMNSRILQGCKKPLYVALHEPKDIRRQKLAHRHAHRTKHLRPNVSNVPVGPGPVFPTPTVYYPSPGGGSTPFGYGQPPQNPMVPRQTVRSPWPSAPQQHQPPQFLANTGSPQYVQSGRPSSRGGRGGGQMGGSGRGGRGGAINRRNNQGQVGNPQEVIGMVPQEFSLNQLEQYPADQQKLLLGERLYPMIYKSQPGLAGKITGMLLDSGWSIEELFGLLSDEEKLKGKIDEAFQVLQRAQQEAEVTQYAPGEWSAQDAEGVDHQGNGSH